MTDLDRYETQILSAYEASKLSSVGTKTELARLKAAARATGIKDERVNIRLSAGDLQDIQVKAVEAGMPYQTLIASVLHKYVNGKFDERESLPRGSRVKPSAGKRSPRRSDT